MKNYLLLSCILLVSACNSGPDNASASKDSTIVVSNDTIPEARKSVSPQPVASYSEPVKDELNDWQFAVSVYETAKTFRFILRIQYKELRMSDSLPIPNFGTSPKVELRKGPEPLSCIIGFLDKKQEFKPFRKAFIKNDQLKLTKLASYYVGVTRTKK
jgi:hypothetical protein